MEPAPSQDLRYPVGKFHFPRDITPEQTREWTGEIAALPALLRAVVAGLDDSKLDTPYRPGGWTVRQVVHHVADSHMNSYVRFKLALTEDNPTIKPYEEAQWAEMVDARTEPVEVSLQLIEALHRRWVVMLEAMSESDFARTFQHPERGSMRLDVAVSMYAWHSRHHVAHVAELRKREGWN